MICNRCGKANDESARFCVGCGASLEAQAPTPPVAPPAAAYCGRCGQGMAPGVAACASCGSPGGEGTAFCRRCGHVLTPDAQRCPSCGTPVAGAAGPVGPIPASASYAAGSVPPPQTPPPGGNPTPGAVPPPPYYNVPSPGPYYPPAVPKNRVAAGLLGIFLGGLGIHNFYLGYTQKAIIQLVVSIVGTLLSVLVLPALAVAAMGIWGFVEGIMILTGHIAVDGRGIPLQQ